MAEMALKMDDPTAYVLSVVRDKSLKREHVAIAYALALHADDEADWPALSKAIVERWSVSGLRWIKDRAWDIYEGRGRSLDGV